MEIFNKVKSMIAQTLEEETTTPSFIIFPYGKMGRYVKDILNNYFGIKENWVIDNHNQASLDNIITMNEIKKYDTADCILLLSSVDDQIFSDIRMEIKELPVKKVVDVFSWSAFHDKSVYDSHETWYQEPRLAAMEVASREIYRNGVEGDIAEVGVYRGDFSKSIVRCIPDRKLYLFDTFEGFSERDDSTKDSTSSVILKEKGKFADTSVSIALNNIGLYVDTVVCKGYFPDTTKGMENNRFCFVSLDTDLYQPIKAGLDFFYERLSPGGYIFIHDYCLNGVQDAVMEFCKANIVSYFRVPDEWQTCVIQKPLFS